MTKIQIHNNQMIIKEKEKIIWDYMWFFDNKYWLDKINNQNVIKYTSAISLTISCIIDWLIIEEKNDITTIDEAIYVLKMIKNNINEPDDSIKKILDWLPEKIFYIRSNIKARTIKSLIYKSKQAA